LKYEHGKTVGCISTLCVYVNVYTVVRRWVKVILIKSLMAY